MTDLAALPPALIQLSIPSPGQGVWHLGPVPLRAYALCIVAGIFAGYWLGRRRWLARGGSAETIGDIVIWAVPFGLVGSRIYHVATDYQLYFGDGRNPVDALKIWHGGLGVWGAVGFGALGAWIACRRNGIPFLVVADALAPGVVLAQAIGRWGNYFNQELFGRPTTGPFALEIDVAHRPEGYAQFATFHATVLYESLWSFGVVALVLLADRRFQLGHGRALALYVAAYTLGRAWIENLRIDTVNEIAGLRLNIWTSMVMFVLAVAFFVFSARRWPGREEIPASARADTAEADTAEAEADTAEADAEAEAEADGEADADADPDEPAAVSAEGTATTDERG